MWCSLFAIISLAILFALSICNYLQKVAFGVHIPSFTPIMQLKIWYFTLKQCDTFLKSSVQLANWRLGLKNACLPFSEWSKISENLGYFVLYIQILAFFVTKFLKLNFPNVFMIYTCIAFLQHPDFKKWLTYLPYQFSNQKGKQTFIF